MRRLAIALALLVGVSSCGGGAAVSARSQLDEMERVRQGPAAKDAQELAPQPYAKADEERRLANEAERAGDDVGAALHAERAVAGYTHAFVVARLARATKDETDAQAALAKAQEDARQLGAARAGVEHEGEELDKQLKVAREATAPPPSGPADAQREAARLVAARTLATQARLLCGAARLVAPDLPGLADAEKTVGDLEKSVEGAPTASRGAAPIDPAARARASCLALLTKARRAEDAKDKDKARAAGQADALLAEMSAAAGWEPARDERGVVVVLRGMFKATALTPEGEQKLKELGRVAAAHPGFGVQVVVHDAEPPSPQERAADAQRADAAVKALVAGGASPSRVHAELAGARAPIVDPQDAAHRARNARLEVVFVAPGT